MVVVYYSVNEDGADISEVSVKTFETWIEVSIPRVQWEVSPVPTSDISALETGIVQEDAKRSR